MLYSARVEIIEPRQCSGCAPASVHWGPPRHLGAAAGCWRVHSPPQLSTGWYPLRKRDLGKILNVKWNICDCIQCCVQCRYASFIVVRRAQEDLRENFALALLQQARNSVIVPNLASSDESIFRAIFSAILVTFRHFREFGVLHLHRRSGWGRPWTLRYYA